MMSRQRTPLSGRRPLVGALAAAAGLFGAWCRCSSGASGQFRACERMHGRARSGYMLAHAERMMGRRCGAVRAPDACRHRSPPEVGLAVGISPVGAPAGPTAASPVRRGGAAQEASEGRHALGRACTATASPTG